VADLQRQDAVQLDTAALKALIVGKTIRVRNMVTGGVYDILNGIDGRRLITTTNGELPPEHGMDNVFHGNQMQYQLQNGQYQVVIAGTPMELTVYRLGGEYFAVHSNEFGYANYELRAVAK
jgi:hypothetical protein